FATATYLLSGARLTEDSSALARVRLQLFAGTLASVRASAPDGSAVPLEVNGGRLTPRTKLRPGEAIRVAVVVRRPSWSSWALGAERHERLTIRAPVAHVRQRWLIVPRGSQPQIRFDMPVSAVALGGRRAAAGSASGVRAAAPPARASRGGPARAVRGADETAPAPAPRRWERLGAPVRVTWFPKSDRA